jgi:glycerophosphoryl diester phosphodiesterase
MRAQPDRVELLGALPLDPRLDEIFGEDIAAQQERMIRVERVVRRSGAGALMLQHALVTPRSVAAAHALGVPVLAWTVDEPADLERVLAAEVDGVITNDPRIFGARSP